MGSWSPGQVEDRVPVEEADRSQHEAAVGDGHHRPVLGPGEVRHPEGVPQDDVAAVDLAVGGDVGGQPGPSGVLVGQVARGVALRRVVAGDPEVPGGEGRAPADGGARVGGQQRRALRVERVGDRLAEPVGAGGVDHVPGAAHRQALQLHLVDGVLDAVDGHVEPGAEQVLVIRRRQVGSDPRRPAAPLDVGRGEHHAGGLHLQLDGAVQVQVPVEAVVVVADRGEGRDDQAPLAARLGGAGEQVAVLPGDAGVLFVQADGVGYLARLAVLGGQHHVEVADLAEAVAAEHQWVDLLAEQVLAGVEVVLPEPGRARVGVGDHHLGDRGAVVDRMRPRVVVVAVLHERQHPQHAPARLARQPERPRRERARPDQVEVGDAPARHRRPPARVALDDLVDRFQVPEHDRRLPIAGRVERDQGVHGFPGERGHHVARSPRGLLEQDRAHPPVDRGPLPEAEHLRLGRLLEPQVGEARVRPHQPVLGEHPPGQTDLVRAQPPQRMSWPRYREPAVNLGRRSHHEIALRPSGQANRLILSRWRLPCPGTTGPPGIGGGLSSSNGSRGMTSRCRSTAVTLPRRRPATVARDPRRWEGDGARDALRAARTMAVNPAARPARPPRWSGVLAWALWALSMLALATVPWLDHLLRQAGRPDLVQLDARPAVAMVSAATVGAVLASRRPRHPVGWLLLALALSLVATGAAAQYLVYGLLVRPGALPAAYYAALYYPASVFTALALIGFVLLLTPTGSLPSPRWRWWARAMVAAPVVLLVVVTLGRGPLDPRYQALGGPFDLRGFSGVVLVANQVALAVTILAVVVAAGSLVGRFGRARGVERLQLRWVAIAAALMVLAAAVVLAGLALGAPVLLTWAASICVALLPVAIGAAILRYRLYDLDRIISRTLAYGLLTLLLSGAYAGVALGLGQLLGRTSSLAVAVATMTVAAVFQPARRRIQRAVDRRFNRRRHDAAQTIQAFSARLRQQVDLEVLTTELLGVVERTMQPTQVSLWLRPHARGPVRTRARPGRRG